MFNWRTLTDFVKQRLQVTASENSGGPGILFGSVSVKKKILCLWQRIFFFYPPHLSHALRSLLSVIVLPGFLIGSLRAQSDDCQAQLLFYQASISITYSSRIGTWHPDISLAALESFSFTALTPFHPESLFQSLEQAAQQYQLSDWHYLSLVRQVVRQLLPRHTADEQELLIAAILAHAHYSFQLFYTEKGIELYGYSPDMLAHTAWFAAQDSSYYNLTYLGDESKSGASLLRVATGSKQGHRPFIFLLETLPLFPTNPIQREFAFCYRDAAYTVTINLDQTTLDWMDAYPEFAENAAYVRAALSPTALGSLRQAFQPILAGLSLRASVQLLTAFVRSLPYQADIEAVGKETPLFPDEVLSHPFSDCEDRVALCYTLLAALTPVPIAVISLPDHLTLAVAVPEWEADTPGFFIAGTTYYLNDPTAPLPWEVFQRMWNRAAAEPYQVILLHKP